MSAGGRPRSRGKGMLWKTGWPQKRPRPPQLEGFTPFFNGSNSATFYTSAAGATQPFVGSFSPGLWIGLVFDMPSSNTGVSGITGTYNKTPDSGWNIGLINNLLVAQVAMTDNTITTVSHVIVPDFTHVVLLDIFYNKGSDKQTVRLYVDNALADSSTTGAGVHYRPATNPRFRLGQSYISGSAGAKDLVIAGVDGGNSTDDTGLTSTQVDDFFANVKAQEDVPLIGTANEDRYTAKGLPLIDAPNPYTSDLTGLTLTYPTNSTHITVVAFDAIYAY